jgi:hypothetical protein
MYATLYHEEPDKVPDQRDMAWVPGAIKRTVIKEAPGICVWKSNYGSVHIDISHEVTMRRKGPDTAGTWWFTVAPAIRWPEDLDHQEQPQLDMDLVKVAKDKAKELHKKGYFVTVGHHGAFDIPRRYLRGTEQWLIDLIKDPPFAKRVIEFAVKPVMEVTNVIIEEAKVDAVMITGDMGTPVGPFFSPKVYREIVYPWHLKLAESYHKRGAFFFIHSHGYLMPMMDDMVRAGFDAINPISPLCRMNLVEMKEKYGDEITLFADITWKMEGESKVDTLKYGRMVTGLEEAKEIIPLLDYTLGVAAPSGGFILAMPNRFPNEAEERIFHEAWEKRRCYNKLGA